MAQPYVGEIRMFAGNFAPAGWMFCEGQILPISENETLFQLIGTTYGGDGEETFALPDLRGRVPIHQGNGRILAEQARRRGGDADDPADPAPRTPAAGQHRRRHGGDARPATVLAAGGSSNVYRPGPAAAPHVAPRSVAPVGGSQPHTNFQPYLCVNFIISLFGIFPSRT